MGTLLKLLLGILAFASNTHAHDLGWGRTNTIRCEPSPGGSICGSDARKGYERYSRNRWFELSGPIQVPVVSKCWMAASLARRDLPWPGVINSVIAGETPEVIQIHVLRAADNARIRIETVVPHSMVNGRFGVGDRVLIHSDGPHPRIVSDVRSTSTSAQFAATLPVLSAGQRASAQDLFTRYDELVRAFDPAAAELYADGAAVRALIIRRDGQTLSDEISGRSHKVHLREELRARGDQYTHSLCELAGEGENVRITAVRQTSIANRSIPVSLLVGPAADGRRWLILEEISHQSDLRPSNVD